MKIDDLFVRFEDELQLAPSPRVSAPPLIEWKSAFGDLFFRPKGAEPELLWCMLGWTAPSKRPLSAMRLSTLERRASGAFSGRTFFRVVPFDDRGGWLLVRPRRGLVKSPLQRAGAIWKWKANFAPEGKQLVWMSQPLAWFQNWLQENKDEELEAARSFARLSVDERAWAPLCREEAPREIWKQLLPALQKLCFESANAQSLKWRLLGNNGRVQVSSSTWPSDYFYAPSVQTLLALLGEAYPLDFKLDHWRGIGVRGKQESHAPPVFTVDSPSVHEKMEAALLWRDFGREIGKSAEVEAALRELMG